MRRFWTMALCGALSTGVWQSAPNAAAESTHSPGTLARVEQLATVATLPGAAAAHRILYWSTTVHEAPALSSAAVYLPPGQPPTGGWPVIAWAHGTVGLGDDCAYSLAGPGAAERDWAYLGAWLDQGYAIVASDYAGLGTPGEHPYLDGSVEAHNVVDAVKAAVRQFPMLAHRWMVVGQSQGAAAAVTTARYATELGGEDLDYRGAVATGVPAYLEDILPFLGPRVPPVRIGEHSTPYVLYILNGLRTAYPELEIETYLTETGRRWLEQARHVCIVELGERTAAANVAIGDLFTRPLSQIPDLRAILKDYMGLPESGYDRPIFIGQGLTDIDVPVPAALRFAAALKANDQPLTLRVYPADHSGTLLQSLADSVPFARGLFSS